MKKKLPFIVVLGITSLLALTVYRYFEYRAQLEDDFQQFQLYREEKMLSYAEIAAQLIAENKLDEMQTLLEVARKGRDIDFYILQYKGSPLMISAYGDHPEDIDIEYKMMDTLMRGPHVSTFSKKVGADTTFTLGMNRSFDDHFATTFSQQKATEVQIVLGPILVFLILAAYFFKDIKDILLHLRARGRKEYKKSLTRSLESEILMGALKGYNENLTQIEFKARTLENQVLPSLRTELASGHKPPYSFQCTLVRTDINHFSKIFNQFDREKLMEVINEFFTEVSHIVARYDGLIHEFVGDEVIYYFKDQPSESSLLKALSALYDINLRARLFNEYTLKELGFPFTIKSSLAKGSLRFGHLVSGFTLAGGILIETVRVLSHIHEKDDNVIVLNSDYSSELKYLWELVPYGVVSLKGFADEFKLIRMKERKNLESLLQMKLNPAQISNQVIDALKYYRSDVELKSLLLFLEKYHGELGRDMSLKVISQLRSIKLSYYRSSLVFNYEQGEWSGTNEGEINDSRTLPETLMQFLEKLNATQNATQSQNLDQGSSQDSNIDPDSAILLSAALRLLENFISLQQFNEFSKERLLVFLQHENHRVVANFIDVMVAMKNEKTEKVLTPFLQHQNVRIATNALVYLGTQNITSDVIRRLKKCLRSHDPHWVAAGLYALGEIAQHHRKMDPVYYNAQFDFIELLSEIQRHLHSKDPMVSRQVKLASQKCFIDTQAA